MTRRFRRYARTAASWLAALLLPTSLAWSACIVSATGVNFGGYDTFDSADLEGAGNIDVVCDQPETYTISMNTGRGSFGERAMANGAHRLYYNLFADVAHSMVWGDGTGNTVTVTATGVSRQHTVYGSISARQNAFVGNYSDTLVVTLTF